MSEHRLLDVARVLLAFSLCSIALSACQGGSDNGNQIVSPESNVASGAANPDETAQNGGPSDNEQNCTIPGNWDEAVSQLPNARPCWSWLQSQAASYPRLNTTDFWKTFYFDITRFNTGAPSDHTEEASAYEDSLVTDYPWINMAPNAPIGPPWVSAEPPYDEITWPFAGSSIDDSGSYLDQKLRGIATVALHSRTKGLRSRVSIMLGAGWEDAISINTYADFIQFVDESVVPQITAFSIMAERINAEYMGILSVEDNHLVDSFPSLDSLSNDEKFQLTQYYLDQVAQAVADNFTGISIAATAVTGADDGIDWTGLAYSQFDQIGVTMRTPCFGDPSDPAPLTTQFARVQSILNANNGMPWSITELQIPYSVCDDRVSSMAAFRTALDEFTGNAPLGLGMDIAPVGSPADNLDSQSLNDMSVWLNSK